MKIGIVATTYNDFHESVKKYFGSLNFQRHTNNTYTWLDTKIVWIQCNRTYCDKVLFSIKSQEIIDTYIKETLERGNLND